MRGHSVVRLVAEQKWEVTLFYIFPKNIFSSSPDKFCGTDLKGTVQADFKDFDGDAELQCYLFTKL